MINISYLETPLDPENPNMTPLKNEMWHTAEALYKNKDIRFEQLHIMISSDYRQYSPFRFIGRKKVSENWNNSQQNLLILDIDDGLTIIEAKETFKDYKYLIATTKSHQKEKSGKVCDRFRVILQSDNIPKGDAYFKMMDFIKIKYPFIDDQVNTKTGAFLGYTACEYWYNEGNLYDCSSDMNDATRMMITNMQDKTKVQTEMNYDLPIEQIKQSLDQEVVSQIVESCGFEVNRNFKFKFRQDERTPSASIRKDGYIKDFGSDLGTDSIGFVQEVKGLDFKDAVAYVAGYVNIKMPA